MGKRYSIILGISLIILGTIKLTFSITGNIVSKTPLTIPKLLPLFLITTGIIILKSGLENKVKTIRSSVKNDPYLLKIAQTMPKEMSYEINKLIRQLAKGSRNAGKGTKYLQKGISELRGENEARVYFTEKNSEYNIIGYSDKKKQKRVIDYLIKQKYNT